MAYIGKQPTVGNFQVCDAITVVNGQANHMLVSLNGVLQKPGSSFTISGATITFASNLATGDVIDFIILLGNVLDIGTPSDGTITNAKLAQDIISGETALTAEPADTDEFLVSDAGTLKRVDYSYIKGGGITVADHWRLTTGFTGNADPITSNLERVDAPSGYGQLGSAMTESSGVFTFPSTGYYLVRFTAGQTRSGGDNRYLTNQINVTTDNSSYNALSYSQQGLHIDSGSIYASSSTEGIVDVTSTSNVKVSFTISMNSSTTTCAGDTAVTITGMTFIRLGDT